MIINRYRFQVHGDKYGDLIALEEFKEIPFHIKRVYYVYNTDIDTMRGCHAHKTLQQVLICVHGSCKIKLDDGKETEIVKLDKPNEGLFVPHTVWREISDFSTGAVLLVLASESYNEAEYIRDYDEFLRFVNGKGQYN